MYNEEFSSTPRKTSSTDASWHHFPITSLASRWQPHPSPRSSNARPRTCTQQDMYSSDHGARVNFPLNADAMVFEPSSMSECVHRSGDEGTGHVDGSQSHSLFVLVTWFPCWIRILTFSVSVSVSFSLIPHVQHASSSSAGREDLPRVRARCLTVRLIQIESRYEYTIQRYNIQYFTIIRHSSSRV